MTETVLRAAAMLMGVYAIIIFALFGAALIRGLRWKEQARLTVVQLPLIRASLVEYLAGKEDLEPLRRFLKVSHNDVLTAILSFQNAVSGSARDRPCGWPLSWSCFTNGAASSARVTSPADAP